LTPQGSQEDDGPEGYSPVRHLAAAAFPRDCKNKYMLMLTAYMDETGHSQDQNSKFNGMAGLMTKEENWIVYEREWSKILKHFKIPYVHMSEKKLFAAMSDAQKKDLSRCVWEIIKGIEALPIGSIIPMDDYRPLEDRLSVNIVDPYYLAMHDCMRFASVFALRGPFESNTDLRVALVFSDQVEFKHEGLRMFDGVKKAWADEMKIDLIDSPIFRDMRKVTPLQAADVVAFEIYKEFDRVYYQRDRPPRYGYERLEETFETFRNPLLGRIDLVMYHNKHTLGDIVSACERADRTAAYWEKKRTKKDETQDRV